MNILILIFISILFVVGLIINIKKINYVKSKKSITWELEIYHSVISIFFFTATTIVHIIEYTCPEISSSFYVVIHYVSLILKEFGSSILLSHSLSVAVYKHYIIIHKRPVYYENKSMILKWLLFLISFPILLAILNLLRHIEKIILTSMEIEGCNIAQYAKARDTLFCEFTDDSYYQNNFNGFYVLSQCICLIHSLLEICIKMNLLEAVLYFQIFRFMKR